MPTQPARPAPKPAPKQAAKAESEAQMKKWAIIGFGTVAVLALGIFFLSKLISEDRGGSALVNRPPPESKPVKKVVEEVVPLAARPIRLFYEFVKAIRTNDMREVKKLSELEEKQYDLLMTEEHVKWIADSEQAMRTEILEQKIDGQNAQFTAMIRNAKGFDVMEIVLPMHQRGSAEDWVVTKVLTRYLAASGKTPENRAIELGANRAAIAAPLKDPSTFNKLPEAEPKKLDWIAGTTEAQKAEIERHMRDLFDIKNPARSGAASQALTNIGKPAMPKLLSEFVGLDLKKEDDIIRGNIVDRTLAVMTDLEMGFDPAQFQSTGAIPPNEGRMRAIRRWFGWWDKNKENPLPSRNADPK